MALGRILLVTFVVLTTVIGFVAIQNFSSDENKSIDVNNFFSQNKVVQIDVSDVVGSVDIGK